MFVILPQGVLSLEMFSHFLLTLLEGGWLLHIMGTSQML